MLLRIWVIVFFAKDLSDWICSVFVSACSDLYHFPSFHYKWWKKKWTRRHRVAQTSFSAPMERVMLLNPMRKLFPTGHHWQYPQIRRVHLLGLHSQSALPPADDSSGPFSRHPALKRMHLCHIIHLELNLTPTWHLNSLTNWIVMPRWHDCCSNWILYAAPIQTRPQTCLLLRMGYCYVTQCCCTLIHLSAQCSSYLTNLGKQRETTVFMCGFFFFTQIKGISSSDFLWFKDSILYLKRKLAKLKLNFYFCFNSSRIYWLLFIIIQRLNIIMMTFLRICFFPLKWIDLPPIEKIKQGELNPIWIKLPKIRTPPSVSSRHIDTAGERSHLRIYQMSVLHICLNYWLLVVDHLKHN